MGYFCAAVFSDHLAALARVHRDRFRWNVKTGRFERKRYGSIQHAYIVQCLGGRWIITNA